MIIYVLYIMSKDDNLRVYVQYIYTSHSTIHRNGCYEKGFAEELLRRIETETKKIEPGTAT